MSNKWKKSIVMGTLCAPIGVVIGLFIGLDAIGSGYEFFAVYAGAAAFLTPTLLWRLIVARTEAYTILRGALTGAISGVLSHFVTWYLFILSSNVCYWAFGGCKDSLGEGPMNPLEGLAGAAGLSFFSLLFFGWITVPIGAILGGLLARSQRVKRPE